MSENIKYRIGRAIREAFMMQRINVDHVTSLHGIVPPIKFDLIANTILEELRTPTPAMLEAGEKQQRESGPIYDFHTDRIWRVMIDEALK